MNARTCSPALRRILAALPERIPVQRIDRVWLFNPLDLHGRESGLVVLALLVADPAAPDDRELLTLRYTVQSAANEPAIEQDLISQGRAPADRLPRLIDGVLTRLRDQREDPAVEDIRGSLARWTALLARIDAVMVDPDS